MSKGSAIFNPDVQSDIDMKNTWKLTNYPGSGNAILTIENTIYVDGTNGSSGGQRGTSSAFQTLAQAMAVAQDGDTIVIRPGNYVTSSTVTINKSVFIDAYGAKFVASAKTDGTKLSITAADVRINGLSIDALGSPERTLTDVVLNSTTTITSATGAFTNADVNRRVTFRNQKNAFPNNYIASVTNGTTAVLSFAAGATAAGVNMEIWAADSNAGLIEITGARCKLTDLYLHDFYSMGIRIGAGSDGSRIKNCRVENFTNGITGANYSATPIHDVIIEGCRASRCRYDSYRLSTEGYSGTGASYRGAIIIGNISHDCCNFGIELFGSEAAEGALVVDNYLENSGLGGISMAAVNRSSASGNVILGFFGLGIEWAECKASSYNICENNIIDETNEDGTSQPVWIAGVRGISVTDSVGPAKNIKLQVQGNTIIVPNGHGTQTGGVYGIYFKDNYSYTGGAAYNLPAPVSDIVIENHLAELVNASTYGIFFDTTGQTSAGFHFINNRFVRLDGTTGFALYQSYSTGGAQTINDVIIGGTRTNMTGTGFVNDTGGNTVNVTYRNNLPQSTSNASGFQDRGIFDGGLTAAGSDFLIADDGVIDTTAVRVLSSGRNLYLQYGSGGHIYFRNAAASILGTMSSTGLDFNGLSVAGNATETTNRRGAANGYAPLDGSSKVPAANLPTLSAGTIASTSAVLKGDGSGNAIASTPTGTGDNVLATSPTLITPVIGVATGTSLNKWTLTAPATAATLTSGADNCVYTLPGVTCNIGFREIPQNSKSADYTTIVTDNGKNIYHPVGDNNPRTFTIAANASVAYPIGTGMMFTNMAVANLTVAITSDTLTLLGTGTTGSRTVAQFGRLYVEKDTATSWIAIPIANVS